MNNLHTAVPATYLPALFAQLPGGLHRLQPTLERLGADLPALLNPETRVPRELVWSLIREVARASRSRDIGFQIGWLTPLRADDTLFTTMLSAPDAGGALLTLGRYFALLSPSHHMGARWHGEELVVEVRPATPMPADIAQLSLESITAGLHRVLKMLIPGAQREHIVEVSWPRPDHALPCAALNGMRFRFGNEREEPFIRLRIDGGVIRTPLPLSNPQVYREGDRACAQRLRKWRRTPRWSDRVRAIVSPPSGLKKTQAEVAALLHVSARTLLRKLKDEGQPYRQLVQGIRMAFACELLQDPNMSIADVSAAVGYGDAASFCHAFKQVMGTSPGSHRQSRQPVDRVTRHQ